LTGTPKQIENACRKYRVYYSKPIDLYSEEEYLIDHSIYIYLMDPYGNLSDFFSRVTTLEEIITKTEEKIKKFNESK
jgi:protein SCO1/2